MEKKLSFREWYFQTYNEYPENPSRKNVKHYIIELTIENFDDTFDKLKEHHKKVKKYFNEHNIKSEPLYQLDWDFDIIGCENINEHGVIFVYFICEENDYEFNERIEKRKNDAFRLYNVYEMNYEQEQEEYKEYLRLKEKFKNKDNEKNNAD